MNPMAGMALMSLLGTALSETAERGNGRGMSQRFTSGSLGGLVCGLSGDEEEAFEACKVVLFPDAWNHWRLLFSTVDGTQPSDVEKRAIAFMTRVSRGLKGIIRHVEVKVGKFGETANPWGTPAYASASDCAGVPFSMAPSDNSPPYYVVFVRFVYRGVEPYIRWPVARAIPMVPSSLALDCPIHALWALDTVYTPSQEKVPDSGTDSPLSPAIDPENKVDPSKGYGVPNFNPSLEVKIGAGVVLAVVAALGAAFVLRSVK